MALAPKLINTPEIRNYSVKYMALASELINIALGPELMNLALDFMFCFILS